MNNGEEKLDDFELYLGKALEFRDNQAGMEEASEETVIPAESRESSNKEIRKIEKKNSSPRKRKKAAVTYEEGDVTCDSSSVMCRFTISSNDYYLLRLLSFLSGKSMSWHLRNCLSSYLKDFSEFLGGVKDKDFVSLRDSYIKRFNK